MNLCLYAKTTLVTIQIFAGEYISELKDPLKIC